MKVRRIDIKHVNPRDALEWQVFTFADIGDTLKLVRWTWVKLPSKRHRNPEMLMGWAYLSHEAREMPCKLAEPPKIPYSVVAKLHNKLIAELQTEMEPFIVDSVNEANVFEVKP